MSEVNLEFIEKNPLATIGYILELERRCEELELERRSILYGYIPLYWLAKTIQEMSSDEASVNAVNATLSMPDVIERTLIEENDGN